MPSKFCRPPGNTTVLGSFGNRYHTELKKAEGLLKNFFRVTKKMEEAY